MSKNLLRIMFVSIIISFDLFSAIEVAYFFQKNLSASEIYLLYAAFSVLIFILEVPTGYIGDLAGHKNSILLGLISGLIGFMGFILANGFWGIAISYVFMALMTSFISGSDDAILYECLKQDYMEHEFEQIYSKIASYAYAASIIGSVLSGIIATYSMTFNVAIQIILFICAIIVFTEINIHRVFKDKENSNMINSFKKSKLLVIIMILAGFFMTSTLIGSKFSQQIMLANNIPIRFFGIFTAIMTIIASLSSYMYHKAKFIAFPVLMLTPALILVFIGASKYGTMILLLLVTSACRALGNIKLTGYINKLISSKYRATINSAKSMLFRFFYAIVILYGGKIADIDVYTACLVSGFFLVISILTCLIMWRKCIKYKI